MTDIHQYITDIRHHRNTSDYVTYFNEHPKKLKELVRVVERLEPYPYKEYGSWILTHICKSHPETIRPFYNVLVDTVLKSSDQTVLRNCVNCIVLLRVSAYLESKLIDRFVEFIGNPKSKPALQVYSIYGLIQFVQKYPNLRQEMSDLIEFHRRGKGPSYEIAVRNFQSETKV